MDCNITERAGDDTSRTETKRVHVHACADCKLSVWFLPSGSAKEFAAEKSLAVYEYGRVLTLNWATVTAWKKVRSRWIRSSRSAFPISLRSWRASRVPGGHRSA